MPMTGLRSTTIPKPTSGNNTEMVKMKVDLVAISTASEQAASPPILGIAFVRFYQTIADPTHLNSWTETDANELKMSCMPRLSDTNKELNAEILSTQK